jgi:iron complex transport system permease protein
VTAAFYLSRHAGLFILGLSLFLISVGAITHGAFHIDMDSLLRYVLGMSKALDDIEKNVLFNIRLPRVLLGIFAGAALGVTGAIMQAIFRNPLAEPGLVGLTAGASLGAVAAIVLTTGSFLIISVSAFIFSAITTYLTYLLGRISNSVSGLILSGIAVNAVVFSIVGLILIRASDAQLRDLTFWNMGSLAAANWEMLGLICPLMAMSLTVLIRKWRVLNALLLGEREAQHLGFSVKQTRSQLIMLVALTVGPLTAVTGGIGFVGLVMPHLVRMWLGADHRWVLPASGLAGAIALTLADWFARVLIAPAELPIGLLTSLVGGPFFIWLLIKGHAR